MTQESDRTVEGGTSFEGLERYKRLLWWTMELLGIRDSVTQKFLFAVVIQVLSILLLLSLIVLSLGPGLVVAAFTPGQFVAVAFVFLLSMIAFANTILVARRDILDPIVEMREIAEGIARGDLDQRPTRPFQVDETGELERAFAEMHEYLTTVAEQTEALRREEFDDEVLDEDVPGELGAALEEMREDLQNSIRERDRELARNERALRKFHRVASASDLDFEQKLAELLSVGRNRLGVEYGYVTTIDPDEGRQEIVVGEGDHERLVEGDETPLERAYCRRTVESEGLTTFEQPDEWANDPGHDRFGFGCYVGTPVTPAEEATDDEVGTVCFGDDEAREFSESERRFVELLALWVNHERQREQRISTLRSFKQAVEHAGHPIYWTDRRGRIQYVNPTFEEVTGYRAEEALGRTPRILSSGKHDDAFYEELWETILEGEPWQAETINERKDGERFVVDQTIAPVENDDGEIERFVAVNTDVTELKEQERKLREQREELDVLRQVQTRVLRHNVRTELNVVRGTAQQIGDVARESNGVDVDRIVDHVETIVDTADKLQQISRNAYTIASVVNRNEDVRRYDLTSVVETSIDEVRTRFPDVTIRTDLPSECPVEAVDGFETAVYNLIENGAEHNTAVDPEIRIAIDRSDDVSLTIEDNGPGIPDQEIDVLRDAEETQLKHGSGAGLWLVKLIVDHSDGRLRFPETDGKTRIVVELPEAA